MNYRCLLSTFSRVVSFGINKANNTCGDQLAKAGRLQKFPFTTYSTCPNCAIAAYLNDMRGKMKLPLKTSIVAPSIAVSISFNFNCVPLCLRLCIFNIFFYLLELLWNYVWFVFPDCVFYAEHALKL